MKDDIRYSEFLFLRALERRDPKFEYIFINGPEQQNILGVNQLFFMEMTVALAEDGYIIFEQQNLHLLVGRLRGEIALGFTRPTEFHDYEWANPRDALYNKLIGGQSYRLRVTYRGLCRIEELRELLKRDRILEPFGVLLDMRYLPAAVFPRPGHTARFPQTAGWWGFPKTAVLRPISTALSAVKIGFVVMLLKSPFK